jgi:hypothetical protein
MTAPETTPTPVQPQLRLFIFDEVVDDVADMEHDFAADEYNATNYYFGQMVILAASKEDAILIYHEELDGINSEATPAVEITEKPLVRGLVTMVA